MKKQGSISQVLFALGLILTVSISAIQAVSALEVNGRVAASELNATGPATAATCFTICFRSPDYYLINPRRVLRTPVLIAGENYNNPTSDPAAVYFALRGSGVFSAASPTKSLNRQFVAAQLSLANAGGDGSGTAFSALKGQLSCYGLLATPVALSTGVELNADSTLGDLFGEARDAILENRVVDYMPLALILEQLYAPAVLSQCPQN